VDPVLDPLLLRKSGSAGNRSHRRGLEPISYRGALLSTLLHAISYRGALLSTLIHAISCRGALLSTLLHAIITEKRY
jgi:hypothetical protein